MDPNNERGTAAIATAVLALIVTIGVIYLMLFVWSLHKAPSACAPRPVPA